MRTGLAALAAFVLLAPAAHAGPLITVSAGGASASPFQHSTSETNRVTGMGRSMYGSLAGPPPVLVAPAGTLVTATLDQPVSTLLFGFPGQTSSPATRMNDRTFTFTVPRDAQLPASLGFHAEWSAGDIDGEADYLMTLSPATPAASNLRLRGSQLSVDLSCPVGCTGFLTLKTTKLRIARLEIKAPGTLTATVRAAALRHLKRHKTKELRVVLTTTGRAPDASVLAIGR